VGLFICTFNLEKSGKTMALREQLNDDIKTAMKARETEKLATLRLLLSEVKRKEVDERITLDDTAVLATIEKMLKQRKDSISQFEGAGRTDLADKEKAEVAVLQLYMPQQLSEAELAVAIDAAIAESGATGPQQMGAVMAVLKPKIAGRADVAKASAAVKAKLAK
jgi:uncharacterized protein